MNEVVGAGEQRAVNLTRRRQRPESASVYVTEQLEYFREPPSIQMNHLRWL